MLTLLTVLNKERVVGCNGSVMTEMHSMKLDVCCCTKTFTFLKIFSNFALKIHHVEMIESDRVQFDPIHVDYQIKYLSHRSCSIFAALFVQRSVMVGQQGCIAPDH